VPCPLTWRHACTNGIRSLMLAEQAAPGFMMQRAGKSTASDYVDTKLLAGGRMKITEARGCNSSSLDWSRLHFQQLRDGLVVEVWHQAPQPGVRVELQWRRLQAHLRIHQPLCKHQLPLSLLLSPCGVEMHGTCYLRPNGMCAATSAAVSTCFMLRAMQS
jgi:hypothetical protein